MFDLLWSGAGTRNRWAGVGRWVRQPFEVVEAALQVTALLPGAALVAEVGVGERIVVERPDAGAANLAEERSSLERLDRDQLAIGALRHPVAAGSAVEGGDSVDEKLLLARIGRPLVQGLDHHGVDGVFHGVVRVEVAGKPEQRPPCRFIQRRELERPDLAGREERDRTGREYQGPDQDTGTLLQELPARWRTGLHGSSFAPEGLHARPSRSSFSSAPRGCCALAPRYKVGRAYPSNRETPKPGKRRNLHSGGHHQDGVPDMNDASRRFTAPAASICTMCPRSASTSTFTRAGRPAACEAGMIRSFAPHTTSVGTFDDASTSRKSRPCLPPGKRLSASLRSAASTPSSLLYFRRLSTNWRVTSLSSAKSCATQGLRALRFAARTKASM